jgi:hypothetical protein
MQIERRETLGGPQSDADRLADWRIAQLAAAGFDASLAVVVAGRPGVDIHALIELVERGCPPGLAARILAPLDEEPEHM